MFDLKRTICPLLVVATLASAGAAQAATYYVDRLLPGSDNNVGLTEAAPFLTIVKCVAVAVNPGDTCLVKNGTYPESVSMRYSGSAGNPITLKNYPGHTPVLDFAAAGSVKRIELLSINGLPNAISYVTIEGLEITDGYDGIKYNAGEYLIFRHNYIHHNPQQGILGYGYNITIDRNRITHNGLFSCSGTGTPNGCNVYHGLYLTGQKYVITNNVIYDDQAYGIQAAGYPFDAASRPNTNHAGFSGLIANNTIAYHNYRGAIVLWDSGGGVTNTRIENNILYQNSRLNAGANAGIDISASSTTNTITNNVSYATAPGAAGFIAGGSAGVDYTASGNSTGSDPLLVTGGTTLPGLPNLSLQSGSPAIDAGLTEPLVTVDYIGTPRPQGSRIDIGAYEGPSSGTPTPPTAPVGLKVN